MPDTQIVERRIEQYHLPGKHLGRHVYHDPRSREFPAETTAVRTVTHALHGDLPLDQGDLGSCTANAMCGAMMTDPYWSKMGDKVLTETDAVSVYHDETELHPANGVYPPEDPGGTGLWVAKIAKKRGWVKSYAHAFGLQHALGAIGLRPCIIGINWYDSFDNPPASGLVAISPNASIRGGHEVLVYGLDTSAQLIIVENSWGKGWGVNGSFSMGWGTFERLLSEQGDCTQFLS